MLHLASKHEVKPLIENIFDEKVSKESPDAFCLLVKNCHTLEGYLEYKCLKHVFDNPKAIFECDSFYNLPHSFVYQIVSSEYLALDENSIYSALYMWAEKACFESDLEGTGNNKRQVLGDILFEIRFPLLPQDFYAEHVSEQGLLEEGDEIKILKHYLHPKKAVGADFKFKTEARKTPLTAYSYNPLRHETWRAEFNDPDGDNDCQLSAACGGKADDDGSKENKIVTAAPSTGGGACLLDGLPPVRRSEEVPTVVGDLTGQAVWAMERFESKDTNRGWGYKKKTVDAIAVTASRDVVLTSALIYGIEQERNMRGKLVIYKGNTEVWKQDFSLTCNKDKTVYEVSLDQMVRQNAGQEYHITVDIEEGLTGFYGKDGKSVVTAGPVDDKVEFCVRASKYSTNLTDVSMGQILGFHFKIYKPLK